MVQVATGIIIAGGFLLMQFKYQPFLDDQVLREQRLVNY